MQCHCRQLRRDLDKAREDLLLSTEVQSPHLLKDNFFKVDFYKPVVASKSVNSFSVGLRLISNFILGQVKLVEHTELTPLAGLGSLCIIRKIIKNKGIYHQKIQINVLKSHSKLGILACKFHENFGF